MAATVDLSAALGDFAAGKADRVELQGLQAVVDGLRQALAAETLTRQQGVGGESQARAQADDAEARTRAQADAAEADARARADAAEAGARAQSIAQERDDRAAAVDAATRKLATSIDTLDRVLRDALALEARTRDDAIEAERRQRAEAVDAEAQARADAISGQQKALADAGRDQAAALADVVDDIRGVTDALSASLAAQRLDLIAPAGRPGDAPLRYTLVASAAALGGPRAALPFLPPGLIVGSESGPVARIGGSGILATRAGSPVEVGRLYRARFVLQRRANPSNPSGDAAVCGIVYLDQSLRVLGDVVPVRLYPALTTSAGRQECEALISRSPGLGAAFQAPADARFLVAVVVLYGLDALTDVEILSVEDVTGSFVLDAPVADFDARLSRYEAADVLGRLERLEQQSGSPSKLTFGSKGDAEYAAIPAGVQVVELLGRNFAGDGGAGLFLRIAGDPAAGADTFTSHGAVFQRIRILPDLAAAMLDTGFELFMAGLPKDAPPQSGKRYNNNNLPAVTP